MEGLRKIAVNKFNCLSMTSGRIICPFGRTDEYDYPCKTTCAWFSIKETSKTIAQCKGINIGELQ